MFLLLLLEQSTDPLSKHQASSAAVYNLTTASSVQILAQSKSLSQPKPGSQVGQPWEPYPSWSFIWYCLKGTRGSSRTWGRGKDPRSSDAGVSGGCCGHIWNKANNSLLIHTATRLTQIRLQHVQHGSCDYTKGKQTFHVLLANRHVTSPAPEEKQQLFLGLSKAASVSFLLRAHYCYAIPASKGKGTTGKTKNR